MRVPSCCLDLQRRIDDDGLRRFHATFRPGLKRSGNPFTHGPSRRAENLESELANDGNGFLAGV